MESPPSQSSRTQHVVVMRHGDRLDNFDVEWPKNNPRPWDPPLCEKGLTRASSTGQKLRAGVSFPINRVFVSPFLRCVQTAAMAIIALRAVDPSSPEVTVDPTRLRASIELGLCEMLNNKAIRKNSAPKDGLFSFDLRELEAMLPSGTVDSSVRPVFSVMPVWPETVDDARTRYKEVIKALADKYPHENLLLVTHGEGVGSSVSDFFNVSEVEYCAYAVLKRPVFSSKGSSDTDFGEFEVDQTLGLSGIKFIPLVEKENIYS